MRAGAARRACSLGGALSVVFSSMFLVGCPRQAPPLTGFPPDHPGDHFTVVGDLQRTLPEEKWWPFKREDNDDERRLILPAIARTEPSFVIMVGDLVSDGSSRSQWHEFDERTEILRARKIPVLAVPGNHEYMFGGKANLVHYFARLPHLGGQRWYAERYGRLGMIFLDSNFADLASEWVAQKNWYEATLRQFSENREIAGIFVFLHHAPFTNSSLVKDDRNVQEVFLPALFGNGKTMAMVTGHVHGYERFERCGRSFVVTGGGGGPRSPLLTGSARRHPDDQFDGCPVRDFNFVEFSVTSAGLHAEVMGLRKGESQFYRMDNFDIAWPRAAEESNACGDSGNTQRPVQRMAVPALVTR